MLVINPQCQHCRNEFPLEIEKNDKRAIKTECPHCMEETKITRSVLETLKLYATLDLLSEKLTGKRMGRRKN